MVVFASLMESEAYVTKSCCGLGCGFKGGDGDAAIPLPFGASSAYAYRAPFMLLQAKGSTTYIVAWP